MKTDNSPEQGDNCSSVKRAKIQKLNYCCSKVIPYFDVDVRCCCLLEGSSAG